MDRNPPFYPLILAKFVIYYKIIQISKRHREIKCDKNFLLFLSLIPLAGILFDVGCYNEISLARVSHRAHGGAGDSHLIVSSRYLVTGNAPIQRTGCGTGAVSNNPIENSTLQEFYLEIISRVTGDIPLNGLIASDVPGFSAVGRRKRKTRRDRSGDGEVAIARICDSVSGAGDTDFVVGAGSEVGRDLPAVCFV